MTLHVSATGKGVVTRLGTGTYVGAERTGPKEVTFDLERIVELTDREVALHGKHYRACLLDGSLVRRTEAEWKRQLANEAPPPTPEPKSPKRKPEKAAPEVRSEVALDPNPASQETV